jgi:hypothetical protein
MPNPTYGSLPFDEAIRFFRSKDLIPTARWADLWKEAHDTGFMVAGAAKADLLADLKAAVDKAIAKGTTLEEFRKDFDEIVKARGWVGWTGSDTDAGVAWRTQVIYEANLRTAYQAGRWEQVQAVKSVNPYLLYRHSDLAIHPRPLHLSWDGLVVEVDSEWVKTHWPPNGWGCGCRMFSIGPRDLAKLGKTGPDTPPDDGTRTWVDKATGEAHEVPNGIDPGWDYAPGASLSSHARRHIEGKIATLPPEIGAKLAKVAKMPPPAPPPVPVGTVAGRDPLPEFREASTLKEAAALTRTIIGAKNEVAYAAGPDGPAVRFTYGRTSGRAVAEKIYGKVDLSGLTVEAANVLNRTLLEVQAACDRLGIPRIRAVHTKAGSANASMGDGVLAVSLRKYGFSFDDDLVKLMRADQPPSAWMPSDPAAQRPYSAGEYFEWGYDRLVNTIWHEFAHHIHHQYGVTTEAVYKASPPLEMVLKDIWRNSPGKGRLLRPSKYSDTNSKEWWAESFALYRAGRTELLDSSFLDLIGRVERGEAL